MTKKEIDDLILHMDRQQYDLIAIRDRLHSSGVNIDYLVLQNRLMNLRTQ